VFCFVFFFFLKDLSCSTSFHFPKFSSFIVCELVENVVNFVYFFMMLVGNVP
jgi:hypothetical protein